VKITILTYVEDEASKDLDAADEQVAEVLRQGKHAVSILAVHGNVKKLTSGITRQKPDLVFNLLEMFGDNVRGDVAAAGLLELLETPYTGSGPGELFLQQDKVLAKKILKFDNIPTPDYAVFAMDASLETGGNLRMPLFVKPLRADASIGIDAKALVDNAKDLMKRVVTIHEQHHDSALAEEFIDGREFYVGVVGNRDPLALPPIEVDFSGLKEGSPRILDAKAKWDPKSPEFKGTKTVVANISDELRARLQKTSVDAYRALKVRDYGRVDLRLTETNEIYVIEVNANCYLEQTGEFATAAAAAGMDYPALINKIVELARERWERERKPAKRPSRSNKPAAKAVRQPAGAQ
jgi:D-alanine-D-alanine ligase